MIFIAHRGLINGPDLDKENKPEQIEFSLSQGYHCEIDIRLVNDIWYLGHDYAQYPISFHFLTQPNLWIHAKNLSALEYLMNTELNFFWHQNDDYTITSHKFIWAYPGQKLTRKSVQVMPEMIDPNLEKINYNCYAICSDWVQKIQQNYLV